MMFYFTIDTIVTAVVSSITVLLVMVIITSLVTVIICMKTSRQKSTPGTNGHKAQLINMLVTDVFLIIVMIEPNPAYERGIYLFGFAIWSIVINVALLLVTFSTTRYEDTINPVYQIVTLRS